MIIWASDTVSDKIPTAPSSVSCGSVSLAEYVWNMVHDEIVQRGAAFRERGAALIPLSNREAVDLGSVWEVRILVASRNECLHPPRGTLRN
jgi:hypothetical protein